MVEDDEPVGAGLVDAMDGRALTASPGGAYSRFPRNAANDRSSVRVTTVRRPTWLRDVEPPGSIIVHVVRTHRLAVA